MVYIAQEMLSDMRTLEQFDYDVFLQGFFPEKSAKLDAEKITQMHEDLFPNEPLQRKMDLHNNKVGRDYFMQLLPTHSQTVFLRPVFLEQTVGINSAH